MAVVLEMYIDSQVAQLVNNLPTSAGDGSDVGLIPGSGTQQFIHQSYVNKFYTYEFFSSVYRKTNAIQGHLKNPNVENQICIVSNAQKLVS